MLPVLFTIGPLSVPSYGVMLALAFLVGGVGLALEFKRKGLDPNLARGIVLLAVFFGLVGSKALALAGQSGFALAGAWRDSMAWHGGLLAAAAAIMLHVRAKGVSVARVLDAAAPVLMLAYGIGRLGCHLSGDGDYGAPTDLLWGARYDRGLVPPSQAFAALPDVAARFPGGIVPDATPCHPTPIYEFFGAVLGWAMLRSAARRPLARGWIFMLYLILSGGTRFMVEFLRINPAVALGLTEAQLISVGFVAIGLIGMAASRAVDPTSPRLATRRA